MTNNIPEVPTMSAPLKPGVDHPQHIKETRKEVANQLGTEAANITPNEEMQEQLTKSNVEGFLKTMGAEETETKLKPENKPSELEKITETAVAFSPFGETDRTGTTEIASDLEEERKEKMAGKKVA